MEITIMPKVIQGHRINLELDKIATHKKSHHILICQTTKKQQLQSHGLPKQLYPLRGGNPSLPRTLKP